MTFRFTKDVTNNKRTTDVKNSEQIRVYKIFRNDNQVVGQFVFDYWTQYIFIDDRKVDVEMISKFFKRTEHLLIDKQADKQIGHYRVYDSALFPIEFNSVDSWIEIGEKKYKFRRLNADVQSNFFKRESWGCFKFEIFQDYNNEYAKYSLKIDMPALSRSGYLKYRPFEGMIETNMVDFFPILSAFYLMEVEFDREDSKYDG